MPEALKKGHSQYIQYEAKRGASEEMKMQFYDHGVLLVRRKVFERLSINEHKMSTYKAN